MSSVVNRRGSGSPETAEHSGQNVHEGLNEEDEWELVSTPPLSSTEHETAPHEPYFDMKLQTAFGRFSVTVGPSNMPTQRRSSHGEVTGIETADLSLMHHQEQSPLFRLPAEIRLTIFEHVLHCQQGDLGVPVVHLQESKRPGSVLSLLQTCRRVLAEAEYIFYSINRLHVDDPGELLAALGPRRRRAIRMVTLHASSAAYVLSALAALQQAPCLKSLRLQRWQSIKYLDVKTWAIMAPQLITEIGKMPRLLTLQIVTPDANDLNEHDMARKTKLDAIDERICAAVRSDIELEWL